MYLLNHLLWNLMMIAAKFVENYVSQSMDVINTDFILYLMMAISSNKIQTYLKLVIKPIKNDCYCFTHLLSTIKQDLETSFG